MIDSVKTTNEKFGGNEIVLKISESVCASRFRQLERKWLFTVVVLVSIWTITGVLFGMYVTQALLTRNIDMAVGESSNSTKNDIDYECKNAPIVSRRDWNAQPPSNELAKLEIPATRVIIAHTATANCTSQASCTFRVRLIQTFHIESRGWDDIGYNFLVGGDGSVYVGRGWDIQGAHTTGHNNKSICIAFIGSFESTEPPKRQLCAAKNLIADGFQKRLLSNDYGLYGHRQLVSGIQSPGTALYDIIKTWDHWTEQVEH